MAHEGHQVDRGMLWALLKWFVLWIPLLTLVVDLVCVFAVWKPDGVTHLRQVLEQDLRYIGVSLDGSAADQPAEFAVKTANALYDGVFGITGIDTMARRYYTGTQSPEPTDIGERLFRPLLIEARPVIETLMVTVQLYGVRLAVLALSLPLFALAAAAGIADGGMAWYLRRVGGGRESAYLYHRFKRMIMLSLIGVAGVYLVVPIAVDPRMVILPFALAFGVAIRMSISLFKKYL